VWAWDTQVGLRDQQQTDMMWRGGGGHTPHRICAELPPNLNNCKFTTPTLNEQVCSRLVMDNVPIKRMNLSINVI
jgi:hypothetical protein